MALRASSLQSTNTLAINREIGSQYDVILDVSKHLAEIDTLANADISGLIDSLNDAKDFTGITVVTGETPSWDATNKILTVPVEKGDAGENGRGIVDIELTSTVGLTKTYTINYTDATSSTFTVINGANGANGIAGKSVYQLWLDAGNVGTLNDFLEDMKGPDGNTGPQGINGIQGPAGIDGQDLTVEQISYDGNGVFTWQFSDGTSYVTPDLRGPQGATGQKGDKGDTGQGIHHIKGTSTTNPNGTFGTSSFKDTYTLYGDASETINLGFFVVANGVSDSMSMEVYDTNSNGIVDNSERLGGELPEYYVNTVTDQDIAGNKTFSSDITVQGNLVVNGTQITVNSTQVTTADNQIVLNSGEVGSGVTAGKAGMAVDRGILTSYEIVFDENDDSFKIGESGSLQKVATREDTPLDTGVAVWDDSTSKFSTTLDVKVDSLKFNGGIGTQGTISWNADEETLDIIQNGAILQVGQEVQIHCRNSTTSVIGEGVVVMATGTLGASGRITVVPYDGVTDVKYIIGVTTEPIPVGEDGKVTHFGKIRGLDTSGWVEGAVLYATANGGLTSAVPTSGIKMPIAFVVSSHANTGTLMVRVTPVNELAYEPKNTNIQSHISSTSNPHGVTKAQVGLANVNNTADADKNVLSATKWTTARTLSLTGAVTGSVSIDGSGNVSLATTHTADPVITLTGDVTGSGTMTNLGSVSITATVADDSHNHIISNVDGLQTALDSKLGASANAVSATKLQTARTIAGVSFDGTADISIPFSGISSKPTTVSGYGLTDVYTKTESDTSLALKVNSSEKGVANGIATLDANGKVILTQIPDSVLGQLEYMGIWNFTTFPTATQKGQYWIASVSGNGYVVGDWAVWNGTAFDKVDNTDAVATVAGRTGNVVLTKSDVGLGNVDNTADSTKNVLSATKLTTARTIGGVSFDGTANINLPGVNTAGNQNTTGNAGSATKLQTAITINGVSFDGTANITVSDSTAVKLTGDQTIGGVKTFSSSPIVPTPVIGDNSTKVATTAYVIAEINKIEEW